MQITHSEFIARLECLVGYRLAEFLAPLATFSIYMTCLASICSVVILRASRLCPQEELLTPNSYSGGQVLGAYYPQQDPSGSSSGSAVAVSVGLALGSLATETSGSIVLPGERSNIVGIKPTLGLTSRSMVIPISLRQDTVGPMARTVKDAAYILSAIVGKDKFDNWTSAQPFEEAPSYVQSCKISGLKNARLGIPRNGIDYYLDDSHAPIMAAFEDALQVMSRAGASVLDKTNFEVFDPPAFDRNSSIVLDTDFVAGLADYLTRLAKNPNNIRNLDDISRYTKSDPREEYPNRDTYVWDRELTRNITNESPESWAAYQANLLMAEEQGVLGVLDKYSLDALIMPTFASFHLPAIAGLPIVTIPLGFYPAETRSTMNAKGTLVSIAPGVPFGIAFIGRRWSEETLISLAFAFEQRTQVRRMRRPLVSPTFELGQRMLKPLNPPDTHGTRFPSVKESVPQPTLNPSRGKYSRFIYGYFSNLF